MSTVTSPLRPAIGRLLSGYAGLPAHFYARVLPTQVANPRLIVFNDALAAELGLDVGALDDTTLAALFAGNLIPEGAEPIALAYAGHQFGHFVPQLGDGRAILLGEVRDRTGRLRDIQLKGCGQTPFSRSGDGRAALGPVLREYLVSESMHALGIPATRALAAVTTGEPVFRDRRLPGAILTRVAASHVRVGTFEYFAARGDGEAVRNLADHVIGRHYPEARTADRPYLSLLQAVVERHARLVAGWMHVGFIHGVMNTDNTALSGETIDFGPCAFMDAYDPATVFSSIDHRGRYAYANQAGAAQWNLARLAEAMLPLIDVNAERAVQIAGDALSAFKHRFDQHWLEGMRRKLGLATAEEDDPALVRDLLDTMQRNQADFTLTFRRLCDASSGGRADADVRTLFADADDYGRWTVAWRARLQREPHAATLRSQAMRQVNPAFIARNHRVEQAIEAAEREDFAPFRQLLQVLSRPYEDQEAMTALADPPQPDERVRQTFCGT